eukprot:jgi/Mesvir1/10114/Mv16833-RA.1
MAALCIYASFQAKLAVHGVSVPSQCRKTSFDGLQVRKSLGHPPPVKVARPFQRQALSCKSEMRATTQKIEHPVSPEVLRKWQQADAVCFDVDSTVCTDEGLDELAAFCGAGEAVAAMTRQAMGGSMEFREALAARLNLFRPSKSILEDFLRKNPPKLSPGIKELISTLQARGTCVYLVSGGFRQIIYPVADLLSIPHSNVYANRMLFDATGEYAGFDESEFTSRSKGKAKAIAHLGQAHGYKNFVMIGDGATDLEARQPGGAQIFIGYGGVAVRPVVQQGADWFVHSFDPLIEALK